MIVELAVAIAANMPMESRDVAIMYPMPGETVRPELMEVEKTGLPVLEAQKGGARMNLTRTQKEKRPTRVREEAYGCFLRGCWQLGRQTRKAQQPNPPPFFLFSLESHKLT